MLLLIKLGLASGRVFLSLDFYFSFFSIFL